MANPAKTQSYNDILDLKGATALAFQNMDWNNFTCRPIIINTVPTLPQNMRAIPKKISRSISRSRGFTRKNMETTTTGNRLDRNRLTQITFTESTQIRNNQPPAHGFTQIPNITCDPINNTFFWDHEDLPILGTSVPKNNLRKGTMKTTFLENRNRQKFRPQLNNKIFECDSFLENHTQFLLESDELLERTA